MKVFAKPELKSWHTKTNFGVKAASADHVCWLGVDDVWLPGRAAAAHRWIKATPNSAFHFSPSVIIDKAGKRRGVWRCPFQKSGGIRSSDLIERLLVQNFIAAPAPIFRKSAWIECGGVDTSLWYTADWDIWLKLAGYESPQFHNEATIGFRVHGGSLTVVGSRNCSDFSQQMKLVLDRHVCKLGQNSAGIHRAALASIAVNAALASASSGDFSQLASAVSKVFFLGPAGILRYLRDSRLIDRVAPRVWAKLAGAYL